MMLTEGLLQVAGVLMMLVGVRSVSFAISVVLVGLLYPYFGGGHPTWSVVEVSAMLAA